MPVMQLNKVVLPAPLGPISEVISPWFKENDTSSKAVMPPKRMDKWAMLNMADFMEKAPLLLWRHLNKTISSRDWRPLRQPNRTAPPALA